MRVLAALLCLLFGIPVFCVFFPLLVLAWLGRAAEIAAGALLDGLRVVVERTEREK